MRKSLARCDNVSGQNDDVSSAAVPVNPAEDTRVINVARPKSSKTKPAPTFGQAIRDIGFNAAVKLLGKWKR